MSANGHCTPKNKLVKPALTRAQKADKLSSQTVLSALKNKTRQEADMEILKKAASAAAACAILAAVLPLFTSAMFVYACYHEGGDVRYY